MKIGQKVCWVEGKNDTFSGFIITGRVISFDSETCVIDLVTFMDKYNGILFKKISEVFETSKEDLEKSLEDLEDLEKSLKRISKVGLEES